MTQPEGPLVAAGSIVRFFERLRGGAKVSEILRDLVREAAGGLERAFAAAPPEVESLLAEYRARFDEALARAAETAQAGADDAERLKDFVERLSRLDWRDAVASAGPSASLSRG